MTLKEKIEALAEKVKNPPTWWWKVLGGLLFFVVVLWIRYLLTKKSSELAKAKNELAANKLKAEQDMVAAKVHVDVQKRDNAMLAAQVALDNAAKAEHDLAAHEAEHKLNVAKTQAVSDKDWDALNKMAGVK